MRNIIDKFILAGSDGPSDLNAGLSRRDSQVARAESYLRYIDRQRSNRARLRSNLAKTKPAAEKNFPA
ncbi:hypothetical protein [Rhizobium sp. 22-785-1]